MRVVVGEFISLDGVVQAPGHPEEDTDGGFAHGGWTHPYFDPEVMGGALAEWSAQTDALLFGRRTWQGMAAVWPTMGDDPFATHMNSVKKYVVSDTLTQADLTWNNSSLIPGVNALAEIRKLRDAPGGELSVTGSVSLVRTLLSDGLVDELRLMVIPVVLGGGKKLFPDDGVLRAFELATTAIGKTGVHVVTYRAKA